LITLVANDLVDIVVMLFVVELVSDIGILNSFLLEVTLEDVTHGLFLQFSSLSE